MRIDITGSTIVCEICKKEFEAYSSDMWVCGDCSCDICGEYHGEEWDK